MASSPTVKAPLKLSAAQKARIERNRNKALLLRQSRITKRSQGQSSDIASKVQRAPIEIDTHAGFFLEEPDGIISSNKTVKQDTSKITYESGPIIEVDNLFCEECSKEFCDSYLQSKFDYPVCDKCRDEEKHTLITKTDAKTMYLLKDEDFDKREPALKYIVRKNPHNSMWGDMKLYLQTQVLKRAIEVWGSEEKLEEAKELRSDNREKTKQKKFGKKLKELRMAVRSSLWRKDLSGHQHEFEDETYNEDEDMYSRTCSTCGHIWTYEKM
uniref:XPA C-terminal domain-containing protein n=1 Tax=Arion vulgaris TaxID=1028688 RepID=A0A0B6ZGB4_9EUPU